MLSISKTRGINRIVFLIVCFSLLVFLHGCGKDSKNSHSGGSNKDLRFQNGVITNPVSGYVDSIFLNADGTRIYFLHSVLQPQDFLNGTTLYPRAPFLPGHTGQGGGVEWNSDLYYVNWDGSAWSAPINMGPTINSLGNECCIWLDPTETQMIFYRDNLGLPIEPTGNYLVTRATPNDPWGTPLALSGDYGTTNQDPATVYRHDVHKTASGDLYLWEHTITANRAELVFGNWNGATYDAPVYLTAANTVNDETQVYVSPDERTMLFNRRDATGQTNLIRMSRNLPTDAWGGVSIVPITGFKDGANNQIWGEPTLPSTQDYLLYIRFDTSITPWKADMMYAPGTPYDGYTTPTPLN